MSAVAVSAASPASPVAVPAIVARGLAKQYGRLRALQPLDLDVQPGERVALFGPNGAGKTTLIRLLATAMRPTSGDLWLGGVDALARPAGARRQLGLVSHLTYLYPDLSAEENLRFYGRLFGVPQLEARVAESLGRVGLAHVRRRPARTFSRGMQQRLTIARATLHRPAILLLDEPETGLDEDGATHLARLLDLDGPARPTLVMATHNHALGRDLCTRIINMERGSLSAAVPEEPAV